MTITMEEIIALSEKANAVKRVIERICADQRATSVVIRFMPTGNKEFKVILKDIRTPEMQNRVRDAINMSLCESMMLTAEREHRLEYDLILA